ncbi:hypothetical protein ANCCAN_20307 [Ancylostoma caninum]|uniref:Uncharacterized protein n=1 Tax=Ancylostoma caninum TaxID=29170 RepID=A0A368FNQ2_ANCCA|nr:hypothetical protein ANCCAN_20307 [Ancylostoma caninum]
MVASCVVADQLKELFQRCSTIEELPHSFDDTLVDNLIDNIDLTDDRLTDFIKSSFSTANFETAASVAVSLLLRLYTKLCQTFPSSDVEVADQLIRTEVLLEQNRPARVLSDLFTLYITCFRCRQQCEWENVVFWAVSQLPNEGLSIFVRKLIEDFLCLIEDDDVVQLFLPSVAELFCCTDSILVMNGTARVLLKFADRLNPEQIGLIIDTVQTGDLLGDSVYQLAARVRPDMGLFDDLSLAKWRNETARCQTIMKLIRQPPTRCDVSDLIAAVLLSPCVKLSSFVDVTELLSDAELEEYLTSVRRILTDRRRAPLSDLQRMISKLSERLEISKLPNVLESCFSRLLESPCLLEELCKSYGSDCLDHPAMAEIRDRLAVEITKAVSHSDWEIRDTVVEIAAAVPCFRPMLGPLTPLVRFDPSPYVRAAALRCLILDAKYHLEELPQLCETVVLLDADAEPRLVAIRYLQSTLASNIHHAFRILPKAIEDTDDEVRRIMIDMCSTLLVVEEYAADTVKELQEWTEDAEVGAAVRAVLGEPAVDRPDPVEHILTDMMNALRIHFEDTIDCY